MPELTSMKRSDEELAQMNEDKAVLSGDSLYPYGLSLHLREEELDKLGMSDLPKVGSTLMLMARVEVSEVSQRQTTDEDGDSKSVTLQVTDMAVGPDQPGKDKAQALYGDGE